MGRQPAWCERVGLKRGPWTMEEDSKLMSFILNNGIQCWRLVPKLAGLMRCGKSCRLRWINYLRPDLKRGAFTEAEEDIIIQLHSRLGNRWSKIASHFPGRTDNEIKNHWNTRIKKKMKLMGLDPLTHKPLLIQQKTTDHIEQKENIMINLLLSPPTHEDQEISQNQLQQLQEFQQKTDQLDHKTSDYYFEISSPIMFQNKESLGNLLSMESSSFQFQNINWMMMMMDNPFIWPDDAAGFTTTFEDI